MSSMNLRLFLIPGLMGLSAPPPGFTPQGAASAPLAELSSEVRELHALRARRLELLAEQRPVLEAREAILARLEGELARVRDDLEAARAERAAAEARLATLERAKGSVLEALRRAEEHARPLLERLATAIDAGITFRRGERAAQVRELRSGLDASQAQERIRPLTELWTALGEELRLARTIDERPETVRLQVDGRPLDVHAYVLRLGLVQELFVAEDGARAGLFDPRTGSLALPSSETASARVRAVMDVARGSRETQLVPAPVSLATSARKP